MLHIRVWNSKQKLNNNKINSDFSKVYFLKKTSLNFLQITSKLIELQNNLEFGFECQNQFQNQFFPKFKHFTDFLIRKYHCLNLTILKNLG